MTHEEYIRRASEALNEYNPVLGMYVNADTVPPGAVSTNPKKAVGMSKPPLHLVPDSALIHMSMAFKDGQRKYGDFNWRKDPVDASTYVAAARRHIALWFDGQERTDDTGVHNLGAAMACLAILLDAQACGNLVDDRPPSCNLNDLMKEWTVK